VRGRAPWGARSQWKTGLGYYGMAASGAAPDGLNLYKYLPGNADEKGRGLEGWVGGKNQSNSALLVVDAARAAAPSLLAPSACRTLREALETRCAIGGGGRSVRCEGIRCSGSCLLRIISALRSAYWPLRADCTGKRGLHKQNKSSDWTSLLGGRGAPVINTRGGARRACPSHSYLS